MAIAVKVRSKHQPGTRPALTPSSADVPALFEDAFLADWINRRLGQFENRPLLLLLVGPSGISEAETLFDIQTIAAIISSHDGHAISLPGHSLLGVWGLQCCATADRRRILMAASEIRSTVPEEAELRCVLHAKSVCISKTDQDAARDAIIVASSELSTAVQAAANLPDAMLATESFRDISDFPAGLLPVTIPVGWCGSTHAMLYALASPIAGMDQDGLRDIDEGPIGMASRLDALRDLKPLVLAAAVVGQVFTQELVARLLEMESRRLNEALAAMHRVGLVGAEPSTRSVRRYCFVDERLQRFAYEMVPPRERLRLHRLIAEALRQSPSDSLASPPDQVARHHRIANDLLQSRRWLSKAAWRAVSTCDAAAAVAHLEKALAQDSAPIEMSASRRSLLQLLGVQLAVVRGNGCDEVFDVCQQSIVTSSQSPYLNWRQEARSLWIAQSTHLVKGEVRAALTIGSLLLMHLRRQADRSHHTVGMHILVYRMHALSLMLSGQLSSALQHYDLVIRDYKEEHHANLRFAYGSDQLALAHAHRAWTLALLGRTGEVVTEVESARRVCERLHHPHTSAHAMSVATIALLLSSEVEAALFAAREARAVAAEYGFPYWVTWSDIMQVAIETTAQPRVKYGRLQDAMAAYQATGAAQLCPFVLSLLSDAALASQQHDLALEEADAGLALVAQNGSLLYRPELLRRRARALFALGRHEEADAALLTGYEDGERSDALMFKRAIAIDGLKRTTDQRQIRWQAMYHATK